MFDTPTVRHRAPAQRRGFYLESDLPIFGGHRRTMLGGPGPRVAIEFKHERAGAFAEEEEKNRLADMATSKWVAEVLHSHYRGHFWAVSTDSKQGVCLITIPILLGNWKWCIPLGKLTPAMVIKAGGEILERFDIPRSRIDVAAFCTARLKAVSRASQRPPGS